MTTAMLWWCTKPSLAENIRAAAEHYENKYGHKPTLCLVHPNAMENQKLDGLTGIAVRSWRSVLPGHLQIGVEEMPTAKEPA